MSLYESHDVDTGYWVKATREDDGSPVHGEVRQVTEPTPERGGRPGVEVLVEAGTPREEKVWVPLERVTSADRPLSLIAQDIHKDWGGKLHAHHPARPYVEAMSTMGSMHDRFGEDDAKDIVLRFLVNASGWRGEVARHVKAELKRMAGVK